MPLGKAANPRIKIDRAMHIWGLVHPTLIAGAWIATVARCSRFANFSALTLLHFTRHSRITTGLAPCRCVGVAVLW